MFNIGDIVYVSHPCIIEKEKVLFKKEEVIYIEEWENEINYGIQMWPLSLTSQYVFATEEEARDYGKSCIGDIVSHIESERDKEIQEYLCLGNQ